MRMRYVFMVFILILTCNVKPSLAGSLDITHHNFFSHRTLRVRQVRAIENAVNNNDSRIASLEEERSHTVFALGEALHYLPDSGDTIEDLLGSLQRAFDLARIQYREGLIDEFDYICQCSMRWQDIAYLAASDDKGRLTALEDHVERMEMVYNTAEIRYRAGAVTELDPITAGYYLLFAETLVEGFKAKTGQ